ncbi:MAG: hypothetical protein HRF49_11335 [bacterium]
MTIKRASSAFKYFSSIVLIGVCIAWRAAAAANPNFWPMPVGTVWEYYDAKGRVVRISSIEKVSRTIQTENGNRIAPVYILITDIDGEKVKEEHFAVSDGRIYKTYTMQLLEGYVTRYIPPAMVIFDGCEVGDSWSYSGIAEVSRRGKSEITRYGLVLTSKVVAGGARVLNGEERTSLTIVSDMTYLNEEGEPMLEGKITTQFVTEVGPWRIVQEPQLPSINLVLQTFSFPEK